MKLKTRHINRLALLLLASAGLAACATTGMQRSERATATMNTVNNDIDLSLGHMSAADSALGLLVRPGQTDIEEAFDTYSTRVSELERHGKRSIDNAEEMNRRGREYFAEWAVQDGEYANPSIREISEQRRADLGAVYEEIIAASQGVKEAMEAYVSDHKEIQTYLSNDLTPKGIEAISPLVPRVRREGRTLSAALTRVQSAIARAEGEMAQGAAN